MKVIRAIVVEDDEDFQDDLRTILKERRIVCDDYTNHSGEALDFGPGADFVFLDCRYDVSRSYWNELLSAMRKKHPGAYLVLMTQHEDETVARGLSQETEHVLETDPLLFFVPKGENGKLDEDCEKMFDAVISKLLEQIGARRKLEEILVDCALGAASKVLARPIKELIEHIAGYGKEVYEMDLVAEREIATSFAPFVHQHDIFICSEERGAHNRRHHRIMSPRFYVFSDPFDGSSGARKFLASIPDHHQSLHDVVTNEEWMAQWEKDYGSKALNSPMVSVVLAERHRVVASVLVNLFTCDVFIAIESGIYWRSGSAFLSQQKSLTLHPDDSARTRIGAGEELDEDGDWNKLEFSPLPENKDRDKLFICSLFATKVPPEKKRYQYHADMCIAHHLPQTYRWEASYELRREQNDFTPGPGRMLFLLNSEPTTQYNRECLVDSRYGCVISSGEPLTEWIGWFAFIRHAPELAAYCLRKNGSNSSDCEHRREAGNPTTLLPDEMASIFRKGHMDLSLLPVAYGQAMRNYRDTILICYNEDQDWNSKLKNTDGDDVFVRIPTF